MNALLLVASTSVNQPSNSFRVAFLMSLLCLALVSFLKYSSSHDINGRDLQDLLLEYVIDAISLLVSIYVAEIISTSTGVSTLLAVFIVVFTILLVAICSALRNKFFALRKCGTEKKRKKRWIHFSVVIVISIIWSIVVLILESYGS